MKYKVTIMSGAGNSFTVMDNREVKLKDEELSDFAKSLTRIGNYKTEGFMAISSISDPNLDFDVKFFNPDGSSGMMCGNGGRCAIKFANDLHLVKNVNNVNFQMAGKIYHGKFYDPKIELEFDMPLEYSPSMDLEIDDMKIRGDYVNVGTDHFILDFEVINDFAEFSSDKMLEIQKLIRNHPKLQPRGANANIYRVINDKTIELSTYERGVEAVTGACGTGAIATAFSIAENGHTGKLTYPIDIIPPSGIKLTVNYDIVNGKPSLILVGPAEIIDEIEVEL